MESVESLSKYTEINTSPATYVIHGKLVIEKVPSLKKKTSFPGIFLILINTTIGSGTLLIPYCFKCGLALVLIVSFILSLVALWSLFMLIDSSLVTQCKDYPSLFEVTFGRKWTWIMHVWIVLVLFGTVIIYVNWCGRLVKHIMPFEGTPWDSEVFWNSMTALFLIFPLTIFKSLDMLKSWSGVALFFILLLLSHAIYWFARGINEDGFHPEKIVYFEINKQLVSTFSVNAMAYDCHCNIFGAIDIFERPTRQRLRGMTALVVYASFFLYNLFGLFTYLYLFDDLGPGAAVEFYPISNWFTKITVAGVIFIIVLGSPMMVWPTRNCIIDLCFAPPLLKNDYRPVSTLTWILLGGGITFLATLGACASSNIVFFFDLIGGLLTPGFVFFLPSIFYLINVPQIKWYEKVFAAFTIIISIGATVVCTYQVIRGS
ncbi:Transmembrane amino acid transporter protein [Tritrichomonas foetus]|uniref:Transmembrane amino acid transporter protein n=1 Tax=Tritrichomonas foetus TaxID=1144522 RepID=A0A1J4KLG0_9EUKA|nr:Transmembrane amino acid transporter protein [Tritrichomonas foetus]|eukprot:OHT12137.1 Transmembrane amino acid transporter protein [Tritrichomonas foetus]